ncbi:MAG TPA: TlpA disulfide reductase family protein [Lacipirellulaceae bacterium]|nr:TlpA disulfide reductase family protein [Lacipirellulaceae bacterium]
MAKPQRNFVLIIIPIALLAGWFAFGNSMLSQSAESKPANSSESPNKADLQHAASSVVAAAKKRVAKAASDGEAAQQAQMALEALRIIGTLGDIDTSAQADELLDAISAGGRPEVVDTVIQLRLVSALREWDQLSETEHAAAINQFVAGIKKTGLTRGQTKMLIHISNMLGDGPDGKLLGTAMTQLLPLAQKSRDPAVNQMAADFEGIQRRLNLPGKPLELEGTLLDGAKLDWSAYRGKVVLVDFFASFCQPCREEVPNILENYRAYHDKGFDVVGVNLDTDPHLAHEYMDQTGFHFPTIFGDNPRARGWDLPIARKYGVMSIPRVILVDQRGNVVSTMARGERLGQLLEQLLGPSDRQHAGTTPHKDSSVTAPESLPHEVGSVIPTSGQIEIDQPEAAPAPPDDSKSSTRQH